MLGEFKPVIKNKKFVYLWISQILSQLTINLTNFLLLIRLFSETGSSIATSLLWICYALPAIVIGPFASASVDMVDRRLLLMITNFFQALVIFSYGVLSGSGVFLLYGVAVAYSLLNQFYVPAEAASLPSLVDKENLPQANSLFLLTQQASVMVGFIAAGILSHFLGFSNTLFIAALLLFAAFVSVTFLPKLKPSEELPASLEKGLLDFFGRIIEGYNFIKENRKVLAPFILLLSCQIAMWVAVVNMPALLLSILGISVSTGIVFAATSSGLGAITSSIFVSKLLRAKTRKKKIIDTSFMVLTFSLFLLGFLVPEFEGVLRLFIAFPLFFMSGFSFVGIIVPAITFLQASTPGGFRGRVFGNFWFLSTIATLFPIIFSGALSELFGVKFLIFILASFTLGAFLVSKNYGEKFIQEDLANG
ncbi:hypothetical protein A3E15_01440 [Candidatus Woesebacteria bacterium RIFCSPHIGHO2_12_FULL_42_9]|uniref:Major facilitator superfamily (MFS) profile domain-containing protein n=3 Tax=Candidatus Woeseibacteriota TaxID=1752722 RepID=A0A1F8AX69_9BACT|nr:MAG: hypothetical protein A2112_01450 [Candidatus Woesebacteria bacterium GWA1_42_12]OGM56337.1 MAG: hypothetical protein A3E15_01440 [Candidatus Woesebacteria bacterium RIFCSPHIGHO2_12_FULL_42_9]